MTKPTTNLTVVNNDQHSAEDLVRWLERSGDCRLEPGLTPAEIDHAEQAFGIQMPPLWRRVLERVHPVSLPKPPRDTDGVLRWVAYPDWRLRDEPGTAQLVDRPVGGVMFDVEQNGFWWHATWGEPPTELPRRLSVARERLAEVPRLTPLRGNLYVASTDESPVFSINQADLYVPALRLADLPSGPSQDVLSKTDYPWGDVPFWSDLHAWSQYDIVPDTARR